LTATTRLVDEAITGDDGGVITIGLTLLTAGDKHEVAL
jgi:hypothetical protein